MRFLEHSVLLLCWVLVLQVPSVMAGMPAPLPTDPPKVLRVNDSALMRLQTISFFFMGFLLSAGAVWALWNHVQRGFPRLPRLSFGKALAAVFLWALLFIIVLTMISGARELMTPGAWKKQGFTYRLTGAAEPLAELTPEMRRRQQVERLRTALWHFAATHQGLFPSQAEVWAIPSEFWEVPDSGGMHYGYVPGLSANHAPALLAYEPELEADQRFVLQTNGDILSMRSAELEKIHNVKAEP
jgi:hypothetical protein